jgi:hypothetical protein
MATGWNNVESDVAETIKELEERDVIETDLVSIPLTVTSARERDVSIGDDVVEVTDIRCETEAGGKYGFLLWCDATVVDAVGDETHWEYAVLTKRWNASRDEWMNSSETLTEVEVIDHLDEYRVSGNAGTGVTVNADAYDTKKQAWQKNKPSGKRGWQVIDDVNAGEVYVTDRGDGKWRVTYIAVGADTVVASSFEEALESSTLQPGTDWELTGDVYVKNMRTQVEKHRAEIN